MKMRGKDYLEVRYRLYWLRLDHPDALIETRCEYQDEKMAIFRAQITLADGGSATGHKKVTKVEFPKFYEKCETGSIGRALANLGYGTLEAGEDVDEGDIVDTPTHSISRGHDRDDDDRDEPRRSRDRDRDDRDRRPAPRRDDRLDDDDDEVAPPPRKPAKATQRPLKADDSEEAVAEDTKRALGFPPVAWRDQTFTALMPIQEEMFALATHDERRELYALVMKTKGWSTKAIAEVREYWSMANKRDSDRIAREEAEDAAGAVLDPEDDDEA